MAFWGLLSVVAQASGAVDCPPPRVDEQAQVRSVLDGDTVVLGDGRHVRLIGINTPERAHDGQPAQPYAEAARDWLAGQLAVGSRIGLQYGPERLDRHGRTLAHLYRADGTAINRALLEQGWAQAVAIPPNLTYLECYTEVERQARRQRRGLWRGAAAVTAAALDRRAAGFHLVQGRVVRLGESAEAWWLDLDGPLVLRIDKRDRDYFAGLELQRLVGRRIEVRGWATPYRDKLRMGVRHARALEVID